MSEQKKEAKRYKVLEYQTYMELYENSNIVKRRFLEGEIFFATDEELNKNQLDRIEELGPEEVSIEFPSDGADVNESTQEAKAEADPKEAARAKLRGGKPAQANAQVQADPDGQESVF